MTCREPRTNLRPLGLEWGSWVGSPGQGRGSPARGPVESQRVGGGHESQPVAGDEGSA